ncbi:MAG: DUF47 family protein, partial [Candidatus Sumerlaeota bacterium]|nr:DUF47 family protein [Candidatus Sumerlaeota bacterium]
RPQRSKAARRSGTAYHSAPSYKAGRTLQSSCQAAKTWGCVRGKAYGILKYHLLYCWLSVTNRSKARKTMLRNLLPKNVNFFEYFEKHSALIIETCRQLLALSDPDADITVIFARIKELEHEADLITQHCMEEIHKTFITPIDRNDIHDLIKRMDDIIDVIFATTSRIDMYEIRVIRPEATEFSRVLCQCSETIAQAIHGLRNLKHAKLINDCCIRMHQLENQGDDILRSALAKLFKEETNAISVIKWKEIYERLEKAIDRCDDVANIIEGVVIEAS